MKFNLKNRPQFQGNERIEFSRDHPTEWFEGFEKKFRKIANNPEDYIDELEPKIAEHYGYGTDYSKITFEDVIQFFIKKEILGIE